MPGRLRHGEEGSSGADGIPVLADKCGRDPVVEVVVIRAQPDDRWMQLCLSGNGRRG